MMPNPLPSMFRMRRMMQQRLGWFGGEASDQDGWMVVVGEASHQDGWMFWW